MINEELKNGAFSRTLAYHGYSWSPVSPPISPLHGESKLMNAFTVAVLSLLVMLFSALQAVKQSRKVPQGKGLMIVFGLISPVSFMIFLGSSGLA